MDPIKSKLNWDYFIQKVKKLIQDDQERLKISSRKTGALISHLKKYLHDKQVLESDFWGYGIERASNGMKSILQTDHPKAGYILSLFSLEANELNFFFIRLSYKDGGIREILNPFSLRLDLIDKVSYSANPPAVQISSKLLDEPLKLKIDHVQHARYYSGRIAFLVKHHSNKMRENLSLEEKAKEILLELKEKPRNEGILEEILSDLNIKIQYGDIIDYARYFEKTQYARMELSKDGSILTLTKIGMDYLGPDEEELLDDEANIFFNKDLKERGHVMPDTNPSNQNRKINKKSIVVKFKLLIPFFKWFIPVLLTSGVLTFAYLNWKLNSQKENNAIKEKPSTETNLDTIEVKR